MLSHKATGKRVGQLPVACFRCARCVLRKLLKPRGLPHFVFFSSSPRWGAQRDRRCRLGRQENLTSEISTPGGPADIYGDNYVCVPWSIDCLQNKSKATLPNSVSATQPLNHQTYRFHPTATPNNHLQPPSSKSQSTFWMSSITTLKASSRASEAWPTNPRRRA